MAETWDLKMYHLSQLSGFPLSSAFPPPAT